MHDYDDDDDLAATCADCSHTDDSGEVRWAMAHDAYLCDHCFLLREAEAACGDDPADEVEAAGRYQPQAATEPGIFRRY